MSKEIEGKDLEKLNQLDRIEYLLKRKRIEESSEGIISTMLIILMFGVSLSFILLEFYTINHLESTFNLAITLLRGTTFFVIMGIILEILNRYLLSKRINELNEKYFSFKITKK